MSNDSRVLMTHRCGLGRVRGIAIMFHVTLLTTIGLLYLEINDTLLAFGCYHPRDGEDKGSFLLSLNTNAK